MKRMEKPGSEMNQKKMLGYYQQFDPIEKKYGIYFDLLKKDGYDELYQLCHQYESNRQLSDLTKKEFGDIYANLKLVYENEELTEDIIQIYDLVYDKVITQYLNIDGMERLFSENYVNFEWEMHLGIDYAGHSMSFYRDHFIHQVRDAYCMDVLLEGGYAGKIKDILGNEGNSKISRYVCKYINRQLESEDRIENEINYIMDRAAGKGDEDAGEKRERRREFYLENIIYMSSYMSALFHDIGYPEVSNMQSGRNILAYIANAYNFGSVHMNFDRIITMLQNSLLFRVVSPKEIRERIGSEKIDHGTVSALMFLLHFYENGAIYGLEPYKKCAVEIAGLAIYNHTNSYAYVLEGKDAREALYQKSVFVLNPISYLLRICDDLQEWDRIYFEISTNANIIFCTKCNTPLVRRNWAGKRDVYYLCNCNERKEPEKSGRFGTVFRRGNFPYRRLYNVTVCKGLRFEVNKNRHFFKLDYDLERLLYVAYINPSYAKYRVKELNQLKRMFVRQDVEEMVFMEYFMSANILLVKSRIVGKYLEGLKLGRNLTSCVGRMEKEAEKIAKSANPIGRGLHEKLVSESQKLYLDIRGNRKELKDIKLPVDVESYFGKNFYLYIYLYLVMRVGMYANRFEVQSKGVCDILENLWENFEMDSRYTGDVLFLIKDCCRQAVKLYEGISAYDYYPDKYLEQFQSDEGMESYFLRFAHSDNYVPVMQREAEDMWKLDAYTDLCFFKVMLGED